MRKGLAALLVMLVAVPAIARPVCEMGCDTQFRSTQPCCCGAQARAGDGPSLTAPPCCPAPASLLDGAGDLDGIPAGRTDIGQDRPGPFLFAGLPAAPGTSDVSPAPRLTPSVAARPPNPASPTGTTILLL